MPYEQMTAIFHLDTFGRMPPGRLVYAEDRPGGQADIYFHPLHVREPLVWELNWIARQQVGMGHWRQRWTSDGRMQEAPKGLGIAMSRWEIVSSDRMPKGRHVFPVEEGGSCIWLIRGGSCTAALRDEHNQLLRRIAGDGLWVQAWSGGKEQRPEVLRAPLLAPSVRAISV